MGGYEKAVRRAAGELSLRTIQSKASAVTLREEVCGVVVLDGVMPLRARFLTMRGTSSSMSVTVYRFTRDESTMARRPVPALNLYFHQVLLLLLRV